MCRVVLPQGKHLLPLAMVLNMLMAMRRRVEEEVTRVISDETLRKHEKLLRERNERMRYEKNRLDSFDSPWFKLDLSIAQHLAKAGFYLGGAFTKHTVCFLCGLRKHLSFWQQGHDPVTVHRRERPDCQFINGRSNKVPISAENRDNKKITSKSLSLPNKSQDPTAGLGSVIKTDQHLKENNRTIRDTNKNTDSHPTRNQEGDAIKKINKFSTKLRPSSVQTLEPDSTPGTRKRRRLTGVSTTSTTSTRNPDESEKVSVSKSFCYTPVTGKIMEST